jgi:hypothetical protein
MTLALVVLALFCLSAISMMWWRHRLPAFAFLATALVWPLVNRPLEGPVLIVVAPKHGLTVSDLLTPVAVAVVALQLSRLRRVTDPPAE